MTGFDAVGRLAIAQVPQALTNVSAGPSGVAGTGTAGSLALGSVVTRSPLGVAGIGAVGLLVASISLALSGVQGVGQAGAATPQVSPTTVGVAGTGVGRAGVANPISFPTGVAGIGTVGAIGASSTTPSLVGVAATGTAGTIAISVGGVPLGVAGIGRAGIATVSISGGGTSEPRQSTRRRSGLQPVQKRFEVPKPEPVARIAPPPIPIRHRPAPRPMPPAPLVDPDLVPRAPTLIQQIAEAERVSEMIRALREQDEQDIADLQAFLDQQGTS